MRNTFIVSSLFFFALSLVVGHPAMADTKPRSIKLSRAEAPVKITLIGEAQNTVHLQIDMREVTPGYRPSLFSRKPFDCAYKNKKAFRIEAFKREARHGSYKGWYMCWVDYRDGENASWVNFYVGPSADKQTFVITSEWPEKD